MGRRLSPGTDSVRCADAAGAPHAGLRSGACLPVLASDPALVAQFETHPVWSTLPAVRARRVPLIPCAPVGRFEAPPAPNRLIGIKGLSAVLHPQRVHCRLDERLVATFEWLHHRRPPIAQMRALLATTR